MQGEQEARRTGRQVGGEAAQTRAGHQETVVPLDEVPGQVAYRGQDVGRRCGAGRAVGGRRVQRVRGRRQSGAAGEQARLADELQDAPLAYAGQQARQQGSSRWSR